MDISYGYKFSDAAKIMESLTKKEFWFVCANNNFTPLSDTIYRETLLVDSNPISFIEIIELDKGKGYITLATKNDPKFRDKGYAKLLLSRAINQVKQKSIINKLVYLVDSDNIASINLIRNFTTFKNIRNIRYTTHTDIVYEMKLY